MCSYGFKNALSGIRGIRCSSSGGRTSASVEGMMRPALELLVFMVIIVDGVIFWQRLCHREVFEVVGKALRV